MQCIDLRFYLSLKNEPWFGPGVNFINILCGHFSYKSLLSSFFLLRVGLWTNFLTRKLCVKCWWNWPLLALKTHAFSACVNGMSQLSLKLRCDERFTHAFTACGRVFKVITLVWANQGNFFENATACSKRTLKTTVATQLKRREVNFINVSTLG